MIIYGVKDLGLSVLGFRRLGGMGIYDHIWG